MKGHLSVFVEPWLIQNDKIFMVKDRTVKVDSYGIVTVSGRYEPIVNGNLLLGYRSGKMNPDVALDIATKIINKARRTYVIQSSSLGQGPTRPGTSTSSMAA